MITRLKLKPGQKGTRKLMEKYGDALICVRYRYDAESCLRFKTSEIIIEKSPWTPPLPKFADNELVPVRIGYTESELHEQAKLARGRWDPKAKLWHIRFGKIKGTELEKRIISI